MPSFPEFCPTIGNGETKRNEAGNEQETKRYCLCKIGNGPETRNGNEAPFFAPLRFLRFLLVPHEAGRMRLIVDTHEPWPHPLARYLPQGDLGPRRPLGRIGAVILFENPRMITRPAAITAFLLPILLHIDRDYSTAPRAGLRLGPWSWDRMDVRHRNQGLKLNPSVQGPKERSGHQHPSLEPISMKTPSAL